MVDAHALAAHGHVRATKDLDIWVRPASGNASRVLRALATFGAPLHDLSTEGLTQPGLIFQIGVPPVRVDVITAIDGIEFHSAWADRVETELGGVRAPVLSREHLITNKRASGRHQDLADVERLEAMEEAEDKPSHR